SHASLQTEKIKPQFDLLHCSRIDFAPRITMFRANGSTVTLDRPSPRNLVVVPSPGAARLRAVPTRGFMSFSQLGLSEKVLAAVQAAGYTTPPPIPQQPTPPPPPPPHPSNSKPYRTCSRAATCSALRRPAPARPPPSRCRCSQGSSTAARAPECRAPSSSSRRANLPRRFRKASKSTAPVKSSTLRW